MGDCSCHLVSAISNFWHGSLQDNDKINQTNTELFGCTQNCEQKQQNMKQREWRLPGFLVSVTAVNLAASLDIVAFMLLLLADRLMVVVDIATVLVSGRGIPFTLQARYVLGLTTDCCGPTSD